MGMKKYLVVHPKLSLRTAKGKLKHTKAGTEVDLDDSTAESMVARGFLKLVVAKKPKAAKEKPKAKAKKK